MPGSALRREKRADECDFCVDCDFCVELDCERDDERDEMLSAAPFARSSSVRRHGSR